MKKLFICEFITGGGMYAHDIPPNLVNEGDLMLQAVVDDCLQIDDIDINITRDSRLVGINKPVKIIRPGSDPWASWKECIGNAEYVLAIAPESNQALFNLIKLIEDSPAINLGCRSEAVSVTGSKYMTYEILAEAGIKVIPTFLAEDKLPVDTGRWMLKPDDGVGGENIEYHSTRKGLLESIDSLADKTTYIVQPYIDGIAASMTLICNGDESVVLSCNRQLIVLKNKTVVLSKVIVSDLEIYRDQMVKIANKISRVIPGLWGFVGVDVIISKHGIIVVEINPRLTSAYAGLGKSLSHNPAEWLFDLQVEGSLPDIKKLTPVPVNVDIH